MATLVKEREEMESEEEDIQEEFEEEQVMYPGMQEEELEEDEENENDDVALPRVETMKMSNGPVSYPTLEVGHDEQEDGDELYEGRVPTAPAFEDDEAHMMHPSVDVYGPGGQTIASPTSLVSYSSQTVQERTKKDVAAEKGKEAAKSAGKGAAKAAALGTAHYVVPLGSGIVGAGIDFKKDGDFYQAAAVGVGATGGAVVGTSVGMLVGSVLIPVGPVGMALGGFVGASLGSTGGSKMLRKMYRIKNKKGDKDEEGDLEANADGSGGPHAGAGGGGGGDPNSYPENVPGPNPTKEGLKAAKKAQVNGEYVIKTKELQAEGKKLTAEMKKKHTLAMNNVSALQKEKRLILQKRHKAEISNLAAEQKPTKTKLAAQKQQLLARQKEEEQSLRANNSSMLKELHTTQQNAVKTLREQLAGSTVAPGEIQRHVKDMEQQNSKEKQARQKEAAAATRALVARAKEEQKALDKEQEVIYKQLQDQEAALKRRQESELATLKERFQKVEERLGEMLKKEVDLLKEFQEKEKRKEQVFEVQLAHLLDRQRFALDEIEQSKKMRLDPAGAKMDEISKKYVGLKRNLSQAYDSQIASCCLPPITNEKILGKQELERKKAEQLQGYKVQELVDLLPIAREKNQLEIVLSRQREMILSENEEQVGVFSRDCERQRRLFNKSFEVERKAIDFDIQFFEQIREVEEKKQETSEKLQEEANKFAEELMKERGRFNQEQLKQIGAFNARAGSDQQQLAAIVADQERQNYDFDLTMKQKMDDFREQQKQATISLDEKIKEMNSEYEGKKQQLYDDLRQEYITYQQGVQEEVSAEQEIVSAKADERAKKSEAVEAEVQTALNALEEENSKKLQEANEEADKENSALRMRHNKDIENITGGTQYGASAPAPDEASAPMAEEVMRAPVQVQVPLGDGTNIDSSVGIGKFTRITFSDPLVGGKDFRFPLQIESNAPEFGQGSGTVSAWVIVRRCNDFSQLHATLTPIGLSNGIELPALLQGNPRKSKIDEWNSAYKNLINIIMGSPQLKGNPNMISFLKPTAEDMEKYN